MQTSSCSHRRPRRSKAWVFPSTDSSPQRLGFQQVRRALSHRPTLYPELLCLLLILFWSDADNHLADCLRDSKVSYYLSRSTGENMHMLTHHDAPLTTIRFRLAYVLLIHN